MPSSNNITNKFYTLAFIMPALRRKPPSSISGSHHHRNTLSLPSVGACCFVVLSRFGLAHPVLRFHCGTLSLQCTHLDCFSFTLGSHMPKCRTLRCQPLLLLPGLLLLLPMALALVPLPLSVSARRWDLSHWV